MANKAILYRLEGQTDGNVTPYIDTEANINGEFLGIQATGRTTLIKPAGSIVAEAYRFDTPRIESRNGKLVYMGPYNKLEANATYDPNSPIIIPSSGGAFIVAGTSGSPNSGSAYFPYSTGVNDGGSLGDESTEFPVPFPVTLSNLYFTGDADATGDNILTVYKNGEATALSVNVDSGTTGNNTSVSVDFETGDIITMFFETENGDFSAMNWSFQVGSTATISYEIITRERATGDIDGVNTEFTLENSPTAGTEEVFLNGVLQVEGVSGNYTISGNTITFNTPPVNGVSGSTIFVNYMIGVVPETFITREVPSGAIDGDNTEFTLAYTPVSGSDEVYLNGQLMQEGVSETPNPTLYTIAGTLITISVAPALNSSIVVSYRKL